MIYVLIFNRWVFEGARSMVQKVHGALSGAKGKLGEIVLG